MDTVRLGKRNPLEMPYLNRKFVCSAETAHDAGKVDGPIEFGSKQDYQLQQALNVLKVQQIVVSKMGPKS